MDCVRAFSGCDTRLRRNVKCWVLKIIWQVWKGENSLNSLIWTGEAILNQMASAILSGGCPVPGDHSGDHPNRPQRRMTRTERQVYCTTLFVSSFFYTAACFLIELIKYVIIPRITIFSLFLRWSCCLFVLLWHCGFWQERIEWLLSCIHINTSIT